MLIEPGNAYACLQIGVENSSNEVGSFANVSF
jgi:hypothetical protein